MRSWLQPAARLSKGLVIFGSVFVLTLCLVPNAGLAKPKPDPDSWKAVELPSSAKLDDAMLLSDASSLIVWLGDGYYSLKDGECKPTDIARNVRPTLGFNVTCAGKRFLTRKEKAINTLGFIKDNKFVELNTDDGKRVAYIEGDATLSPCTSGDPMSPYMTIQYKKKEVCFPLVFDGSGFSLLTAPKEFNNGRIGKIGDSIALFQIGGPVWKFVDGKAEVLTTKKGEPFKCDAKGFQIQTAGDYFCFVNNKLPSPTYFVDGLVVKKVEVEKARNLFSVGDSVFLMAADEWPIPLNSLKKGKARLHSPASKILGSLGQWYGGRGSYGVGAKWGKRGSVLIKLDEKKAKDITLPRDHRVFTFEQVHRAADGREEFLVQTRIPTGLVPMLVDKSGVASVLRTEDGKVRPFRFAKYAFGVNGTYMIVEDGKSQQLLYRARTDK